VCDLETSRMGAPYNIYDISRLRVKSIISCIQFLHPIMCDHTGQLGRNFQVMF